MFSCIKKIRSPRVDFYSNNHDQPPIKKQNIVSCDRDADPLPTTCRIYDSGVLAVPLWGDGD